MWARDFVCVCCSLYLRLGAERKVTLKASSEYKCRSLLTGALPALLSGTLALFSTGACNLSQGRKSPAAGIVTKTPTLSFVTYCPTEHGNPVGPLRGRKDQPWFQRGHEDPGSWTSPGTHLNASSQLSTDIYPSPLSTDSSHRFEEPGARQGLRQEARCCYSLRQLRGAGQQPGHRWERGSRVSAVAGSWARTVSCSIRRRVSGSAAHRALESGPAVPGGREECSVWETFRNELQRSKGTCCCSQEEQGLPHGGKDEGMNPFFPHSGVTCCSTSRATVS